MADELRDEVLGLGAIPLPKAASGWLPIATAPKDGTPLLFVAEGKVFAGWYRKDFAPFPWVFVDDTSESLAGCCDYEMTGRVNANGYPDHLPTHWMPLPDPPDPRP